MMRSVDRDKGIVEMIVKYDDGTAEIVNEGVLISEPRGEEFKVTPFNIEREIFTGIMLAITSAHLEKMFMGDIDED